MAKFSMMDALIPGGGVMKSVAEQLLASVAPVSTNVSLEELNTEARKQELKAAMARESARAAQEFAIAQRIAMAQEVEIEEFYDVSGEASAGFKGDLKSETASLGVSGSGKRVTKRIFKFRGFNDLQGAKALQEVMNQNL